MAVSSALYISSLDTTKDIYICLTARNSDGDIDPRFYADRAGVIAISQLTFVIALAGKNNIISCMVSSFP